MTEELQVPDELLSTFKRLLGRIPYELRDAPQVQEKILVFLKFGGEKLARQQIDVMQKRFMEEIDIIKRKASEDQEDGEDPDGDE